MTAATAAGIDVRARVAQFHQEHYSANLMRLAVYGKEVRGGSGVWNWSWSGWWVDGWVGCVREDGGNCQFQKVRSHRVETSQHPAHAPPPKPTNVTSAPPNANAAPG